MVRDNDGLTSNLCPSAYTKCSAPDPGEPGCNCKIDAIFEVGVGSRVLKAWMHDTDEVPWKWGQRFHSKRGRFVILVATPSTAVSCPGCAALIALF